jgi:hypothetical protein
VGTVGSGVNGEVSAMCVGGGSVGTVGSGVNGEATAMCVGGGSVGTVGSGVNGEATAMCVGGGSVGTVGSGVNGEATVTASNATAKIEVQILSILEVIEALLPWVKRCIKIVPLKLYEIYNKSNFFD